MIRIDRQPILVVLIGLLVLSTGCSSTRSWQKINYQPKGELLEAAQVQKIQSKNKNDSTLIGLEYALSHLRSENGDTQQAKAFLEQSVLTFEDLKAPKNMSSAFSQDIDKPYRGRAHERVFASMLLAMLDMTEGRYDMAIPSLKNAEFLDARWQAMKYGTDSPLIYALELFALKQNQQVGTGDFDRARFGLENALRLQNALGVQTEVREHLDTIFDRPKSLSYGIASRLFEEALLSALMKSDERTDISVILKTAVADAQALFKSVEEMLDYDDLAIRYGSLQKYLGKEDFEKILEETKSHMGTTLQDMALTMADAPVIQDMLSTVLTESRRQADAIHHGVTAGDILIKLEGNGPQVERIGQYGEVARIQKSESSREEDGIHTTRRDGQSYACGVHQGTSDDATWIRLCAEAGEAAGPIAQEGYGLWSSSYQATSVVGRRFEEVLKDRARFKRTTDDVAKAGLTISGQMFQAAGDACNDNDEESCLAAAGFFTVLGLITGIVSLVSYSIGQATHPEADNRYVRNLYENVEIYTVSDAMSTPVDIHDIRKGDTTGTKKKSLKDRR